MRLADRFAWVIASPFIAVLFVLYALCRIVWFVFRLDWDDFPLPI